MTEKEVQLHDDVVRAFHGDSGERVLNYLAHFTHADEDNFVDDSERRNAYYQGRRSVMLEIRKILNQKREE
jgi:hypothetical protein